jgi:hypothetical protein
MPTSYAIARLVADFLPRLELDALPWPVNDTAGQDLSLRTRCRTARLRDSSDGEAGRDAGQGQAFIERSSP